jgi:hypothetical protein
MSGYGAGVHAQHDHEVGHQVHHGPGPELTQSVAILAAIGSIAGAVVGYRISTTLNEAMPWENGAVPKRTETPDRRNFCQTKYSMQQLVAVAADLTDGAEGKRYRKEAAHGKEERRKINNDARRREHTSRTANDWRARRSSAEQPA